jgi:DNA-damage-inducible protein J
MEVFYMEIQRSSATKLIQFRVNENIKREADAIFSGMGLDTQTALRIFLYKAVRKRGMPFNLTYEKVNENLTACMKQDGRLSEDGETVLPNFDDEDWEEYSEYGEV